MIGLSSNQDTLRQGEFWALQDINFELKKGETLGLIGQNGCGKSTLLRMINGIFPPDKGRITINGRIGALIAVGAGFHPHMSGRENIFLNGIILGMTKKEIKLKYDKIVEFAEIGDFLEAPVATYSSGMTVRLGFSIAIHSNPDIVLVDEILAVGDAKFQRKCLDEINFLRKEGVSFFLVSHNTWNIEAMCSRAILLQHGKLLMQGNSGEVASRYELLLMNNNSQDNVINDDLLINTDFISNLKRLFYWKDWGTHIDIIIKSMLTSNQLGAVTNLYAANEPFVLRAILNCSHAFNEVYLYLSFRYIVNELDLTVNMENENIESLAVRRKISLRKGINNIEILYKELFLATGKYMIGFMVYDESYNLPHYNGYFGIINVANNIPTMLRAGKGTPLVWSNPQVNIN
jgi:ABC-type polysaccharide/polyol phosphate transport system ATPase subunit